MDAISEALDRSVSREVRTISRVLSEAGHQSWIVGGCVRDVVISILRAEPPKKRGDFDLCTSAKPEQVMKLFRKVIPTGIEHGTVTIVLSGEHFEITTLRGERGHTDGRRPDQVYFVDDLALDLARRDFTVNAMAFSVQDGTFHDPFGGRDDLKRGLLRAVGEPLERFSEDGLRVLRCARFCSTLGLVIEDKTAAAILPSLASFERVARERVRDEWFKALASERPSRFLHAVRTHGLLRVTAPTLWRDEDESQRALSFERAVERIDACPPDELLRLALFVWMGSSPPPDGPHPLGAEISQRFRLSKQQTARLTLLLDEGRLPADVLDAPTGKAARFWLRRVGRDGASDILSMQKWTRPDDVEEQVLEEAHRVISRELASGCALSVRELAVGGGDLMGEAGIEKGPQIGNLLEALLAHVLEHPEDNQRGELLNLARRLSSSALPSQGTRSSKQ